MLSKTKILILVCVTLLAVSCCFGAVAFAQNNTQITCAKSCVVMERTSGRVLYSQNGNARLPMASTTKIVTAITVIEHSCLDDVVTIPQQACGVEGSSVYLRCGEQLTVRELLFALMLRSGNDCAVALALHIGGTVEHFAEMMNETARSLGCNDSNFVTPHGLHDDNHYTTAHDLATITCYALSNKEFATIVSTEKVKIGSGDSARVLVNKNKLLHNYDGANGVKTGFTKKAGRCFVGSATRNGMQVVVVVLNCGPMFEDTAKLLDYAFANYKLQTVVPVNKICGVTYHGKHKDIYICPSGYTYPVKLDEKLSTQICLDEKCLYILLDGTTVAKLPLLVENR